MSLRARFAAAAALATVSFLPTPSALATSRPVQVNGNKLKSALLPASSFESSFHDPVSASLMLKLVNRVSKLR